MSGLSNDQASRPNPISRPSSWSLLLMHGEAYQVTCPHPQPSPNGSQVRPTLTKSINRAGSPKERPSPQDSHVGRSPPQATSFFTLNFLLFVFFFLSYWLKYRIAFLAFEEHYIPLGGPGIAQGSSQAHHQASPTPWTHQCANVFENLAMTNNVGTSHNRLSYGLINGREERYSSGRGNATGARDIKNDQ